MKNYYIEKHFKGVEGKIAEKDLINRSLNYSIKSQSLLKNDWFFSLA
jgi:hypothetical protein